MYAYYQLERGEYNTFILIFESTACSEQLVIRILPPYCC